MGPAGCKKPDPACPGRTHRSGPSAEEVSRLFDEALRSGPEALDVDLSEVAHISTDGVVPLFSALKKARLSGTYMVVVGASPHVWAALHRVGFDRALRLQQGS
ncbi:STAS domain-containing protein [Streptomyces violascens]